MIKKILLNKMHRHIYKINTESNESIMGLIYFLNDGVGFDYYVDFLLDEARKECGGNISWLEKNGNIVSIEIDDYVYPDTPIFTTSVSNLLYIIKEFNRLEDLEVDRIQISVDDNDNVNVIGE